MRVAYRLALIQWWVALAWGAWLLVRPSPDGFDSIVASVAWCWAGALVLAMGPWRVRDVSH
jgi:hypothetical protein